MTKETRDRDSRSVVLGALRRKRRLTVRALAVRSGVSEDVLADSEKGGKSAPSVRRLRQLSADMDYHPELSEALVDLLDSGGSLPAEPAHPLEPSQEEALQLQKEGLVQGREQSLLARQALHREWFDRKVEEHRAEARVLGPKVVAASVSVRRKLLEAAGPGPVWALVEWLCNASETAASDSARRAVQLAELALWVAKRYQGAPGWRDRMVGYALAFLGNARRVSGNLPEADAAFREGWESWKRGEDSVLPLAEWRVLDLEASLRRTQRLWALTIRLHRRTLGAAPGEAKGRVLVKLAFALEQMGRHESALRALRSAKPQVDESDDPRLPLVLRFNMVVNFEALGRLNEAENLLPEVRKRALDLGNEFDVIRVLWLQARLDAGRGRRAQAVQALSQVRRAFSNHRVAYDTALAGLEEGQLYLELGQPRLARELAEEMHWIFSAQQIEADALAALHLYCQAARDEQLTVELARRALLEFRQVYRRPASFDGAQDHPAGSC